MTLGLGGHVSNSKLIISGARFQRQILQIILRIIQILIENDFFTVYTLLFCYQLKTYENFQFWKIKNKKSWFKISNFANIECKLY